VTTACAMAAPAAATVVGSASTSLRRALALESAIPAATAVDALGSGGAAATSSVDLLVNSPIPLSVPAKDEEGVCISARFLHEVLIPSK